MARDLDLTWDKATGELSFGRDTDTNWIKRAESLVLSITVTADGAVSTIPDNAKGTLKPTGDYSTPLATWSGFTQVGSSNVYEATATLNAGAITTLLGLASKQVFCVLDFSGDGVTKSDTVDVVLKNDVTRDDDSSPTVLISRRDFLVSAGTGLHVDVAAGVSANGVFVAAQPAVVITNATNYIQTDAAGTVSVNTSGFTAGAYPLAKVIASAGAITSLTDLRPWVTPKPGNSGGAWGTITGTLSNQTDLQAVLTAEASARASADSTLASGVASALSIANAAQPGDADLTALAAAGNSAELAKLGKHGANIVAATTINLETATGEFITITGGDSIATITLGEGHRRIATFAARTPILSNGGISILGTNPMIAEAGDVVVFTGLATTNTARVVSHASTVFGVQGNVVKLVRVADDAARLAMAAYDANTAPNGVKAGDIVTLNGATQTVVIQVSASSPSDFVDLTGISLSGHTFFLYDETNQVGAGDGTQVSVVDIGDANEITTALASAIDQTSDFAADVSGNTITVTFGGPGAQHDPSSTGGLAASVGTVGTAIGKKYLTVDPTNLTSDTLGWAELLGSSGLAQEIADREAGDAATLQDAEDFATAAAQAAAAASQPINATLTSLAAGGIGTGGTSALAANVGDAGAFILNSAAVHNTGTETIAGSKTFSSPPLVPTASGGDNSTKAASTAFVQALVALAVTGLLENKGNLNCSANPNYPAASNGDAYYVSNAGKIGGASGKSVDVSDLVVCKADAASGNEASVGTSWFVLEHNLLGALLAANNFSDITNSDTCLSNLGATPVGKNLFNSIGNPGAVHFIRINADNTITTMNVADTLIALGLVSPEFTNVTLTPGTLTYAGTTTIDFSGNGYRTCSLTGAVTFETSNLAPGRSVTVRIVCDDPGRAFTFPGDWKFVGSAAPGGIAAGKVGILTLTSFSTTDADVVAAYAVEP